MKQIKNKEKMKSEKRRIETNEWKRTKMNEKWLYCKNTDLKEYKEKMNQ